MRMKFRTTLVVTGLAAMTLTAQEQSPFQTPVPAVSSATVGGPLLLNVTGITVTDRSGQPLGPIQHILLTPSGCLDLAVMSLGGEKLVPIPWRLVSGTGAARGEIDPNTQTALTLKVDRTKLLQAPGIPVDQITLLTQPQTVQQFNTYFAVELSQQQQPTAVGGTASQTSAVGASVSSTNRIGIGSTATNIGTRNTNGLLSPTGPTNAIIPGRPAFETNRPGITPAPGSSGGVNRIPTNQPPGSAGGFGFP